MAANTISKTPVLDSTAENGKHTDKAKSFELLDVSSVTIDNPGAAVKSFSAKKVKRQLKCDVLIVGGGVGGVAAALKIWQLTTARADESLLPRPKSISVILTEETDWLGGQMTSQGVPALDENYLVETAGATRSYQDLRTSIRDFYKKKTHLKEKALNDPHFNPGNCWVSRLAFEPKVALNEIKRLLQPAADAEQLEVFYRCKPFRVNFKRKQALERRIASVDFYDFNTGKTFSVCPKICLDATEFGDVLALGDFSYSVGSDNRSNTGEPHAPMHGDPENVQDFTYPLAVELVPNSQNHIAKPKLFEEFLQSGNFSLFGYKMFAKAKLKSDPDEEYLPFWEYRRLIDASNFQDPAYANDLSIMNWKSDDLRRNNIIDQPPVVQAERLARAKELSLSFLYWLQTQAPRDEGGNGYPELKLRKDVLGTEDGLSKFPYVRESRRIRAVRTTVEQDVVSPYHSGSRATIFPDSVGIGLYPVDIHGDQEIPGAVQGTKPFQISLASLIPLSGGNLLPACKNIGTTHITDGAYRLHPIEWAIGEAQGALVAYALSGKTKPAEVLGNIVMLRDFQRLLVQSGVPIFWCDDVPTDHPQFAAIQWLSSSNILSANSTDLHFNPEAGMRRDEFALLLSKCLPDKKLTKKQKAESRFIEDLPATASIAESLKTAMGLGLLKLDHKNHIYPEQPVTFAALEDALGSSIIGPKTRRRLHLYIESQPSPFGHTTRAQIAGWLFALLVKR